MDNQPTNPNQPTKPAGTIEPIEPPRPESSVESSSNSTTEQPATDPTPKQSTSIQPTQPDPTSDAQPTTNPGNYTNPTVPVNTAQGDVKLKKSKKGPIALIIILLILLIGGGAFAAAYFINNQPQNIAMSALNNLLNAKQVEVDGTINLTMADAEYIGVDSVALHLDDKTATSGNSTTAHVEVNFTDNSQAAALDIGEILLSDGVFYLETNGLQDFYYNNVYDRALEATISNVESQFQSQLVSNCYETVTSSSEYVNCDTLYSTELSPDAEASIKAMATQTLNQIGQIIESIDGQWIEFSIDDILNSNTFSSIDSFTSQAISTTYNCTIDKLSHLSNYSNELANIYGQYPFVIMNQGQNSFYNISFDADRIANFLNAMTYTQLVKDFAACLNVEIPSDYTPSITTANVQPFLDYLPAISAKFDGFFDHHLTELKISGQNDTFSVDSDLKFSYPNNISISAPADSRPVMDIVEEAIQNIDLLQSYSTL